jgi:hypothetical protein
MQGHLHLEIRPENAGFHGVRRKGTIRVLEPLHDGGKGWSTQIQIIKVTD